MIFIICIVHTRLVLHCFIALRDASKQSINSDWKIEHSGAFNLAGTTVHYIRRGLWEKISAKGPTTTPLHLLVRGRNRVVSGN